MRGNKLGWVGGSVACGAFVCGMLWPTPGLPAHAQTTGSGEVAFRELYKELVEINTTLSAGSCTAAAEAMAARLKAAGLPADDMQILAPADRPKDGALIATLRGQDRQAEADPSARAHGRGGGEARGLGARSVHAGRGGRLVLRARRQRRQGHGRGLHRQPDPLPDGRVQAAPRHQAGADLRRGNAGDVQRRRLADQDAPRSAAGGVRAQRGRGRRAGCERQADRVADPGGRESLSGLHARNDECWRPQFAAGEGQRHLSTGSRAVAAVGLEVSDQSQPRDARVFRSASEAVAARPPPTFAPC